MDNGDMSYILNTDKNIEMVDDHLFLVSKTNI